MRNANLHIVGAKPPPIGILFEPYDKEDANRHPETHVALFDRMHGYPVRLGVPCIRIQE
jgi:hypothetical protein